jgi:hypothetical protein
MKLDIPIVIGVCLDVPNTPFVPVANCIGRLILEQLFRTRLRAADIELQTNSWGELNRADFLIQVTDRDRALKMIKEQLDAVALSSFTVVGWFDVDELVWRSWHPHSGVRFDPAARSMEHEEMRESVRRFHEGISEATMRRNGASQDGTS